MLPEIDRAGRKASDVYERVTPCSSERRFARTKALRSAPGSLWPIPLRSATGMTGDEQQFRRIAPTRRRSRSCSGRSTVAFPPPAVEERKRLMSFVRWKTGRLIKATPHNVQVTVDRSTKNARSESCVATSPGDPRQIV